MTLTATRQNVTEMRMRPAIFWGGVRPRERLWATDSMSSRRPSEPVTSMATRARTRSGVHLARRAQVSTMPSRMTTPPMVGVPCLMRWRWGPSALTCWPRCSCFISLMKGGMSRQVMAAETKTARKTW